MKLRDTIDPCGKPIDLQIQARGHAKLIDWDFSEKVNYATNMSVFEELKFTSPDLELVFDSGIFMQLKNHTKFTRSDHGHRGKTTIASNAKFLGAEEVSDICELLINYF